MLSPWPEFDPWRVAGDPPGPGGEDTRLEALVTQRLAVDWTTRRQPITVRVQNRVVVLDGVVAADETRRTAGELAWDVPGVVDVCNAVRVNGRRRRPG
ncbi:BON domain-containing protein [Micromonospora endolithica]|uniref:BON domain-containing protein n=1 Tax=Micromonospora endolithica TaxID=230091 RepID=A0A3A9ZHL0_9ACTN|nr:BON domain-containing protein [Micromonospora endolithica]RKN47838.1 BON domain-containing protein [Micromonospora endolithica]TWJ21528.1 BON domain-containing protein [Micromonospora endolithica]